LFGILSALFLLTAFCNCTINESNAQVSAVSITKKQVKDIPALTPDSPKIIAPLNDFSTYENIIYLKWTSVTHCKTYEILTSRKADFSDSTVTYQSSDTLFAFNGEGLMRGVVFWKVRSLQENNEYSAWSNVSRFTLLGRINTDRTPDDVIVRPCNGDCGHCQNPCGRRKAPVPDM